MIGCGRSPLVKLPLNTLEDLLAYSVAPWFGKVRMTILRDVEWSLTLHLNSSLQTEAGMSVMISEYSKHLSKSLKLVGSIVCRQNCRSWWAVVQLTIGRELRIK